MSSQQYSHTADYTYLDVALRSRWGPCLALSEEMAAFLPRPLSDYAEYRASEFARLRQINPEKSDELLAEFVDRQISLGFSPGMQFLNTFDGRFMTEYVTVALLSHALCEAVINAILAIGLAHSGSADLFPLLERSDVKQKWLFGPKSFAPSYKFPKGTGLYETLTYLTRQRNALVHYKIKLDMNGATLLDGSKFQRKPHAEDTRWLMRFFSLPYDLAHYAQEEISSVPLMIFLDRRPIEPVHEHLVA